MSDILEILETSNKNLFVGLAGPGTGKTFVFKRIVDSKKFKGKKILILSFIKKLVNDLKTEGFKNYDNVQVSTLHSFALSRYNELVKNVDVSLEPDLDEIVSEDHSFLKNKTVDYNERLYTGNLTKEDEEFYKKRADFYSRGQKLYSFNSIIYAVNRLYKGKNTRIPNEYDLILVDEFQDFNLLEFNLINLLNKKI